MPEKHEPEYAPAPYGGTWISGPVSYQTTRAARRAHVARWRPRLIVRRRHVQPRRGSHLSMAVRSYSREQMIEASNGVMVPA